MFQRLHLHYLTQFSGRRFRLDTNCMNVKKGKKKRKKKRHYNCSPYLWPQAVLEVKVVVFHFLTFFYLKTLYEEVPYVSLCIKCCHVWTNAHWNRPKCHVWSLVFMLHGSASVSFTHLDSLERSRYTEIFFFLFSIQDLHWPTVHELPKFPCDTLSLFLCFCFMTPCGFQFILHVCPSYRSIQCFPVCMHLNLVQRAYNGCLHQHTLILLDRLVSQLYIHPDRTNADTEWRSQGKRSKGEQILRWQSLL